MSDNNNDEKVNNNEVLQNNVNNNIIDENLKEILKKIKDEKSVSKEELEKLKKSI